MFGLECIPIGQNIDVLKPGGWAGDQLIWAGARNILLQHGITFRQFPSDREALTCNNPSRWLYVYGSGGYCRWNHSLLGRLPPIFDRYEFITIMPSSFDTSYAPTASFLSGFGSNIVVYTREKYSYEQVVECCSHPSNVYLEHDTALHFNFLPHIKPKSGHGELKEFCGKTQISKTVKSVSDLIRHVNQAEKVSTDRAHVAITAASLRKPTTVYPGGYHKLQGIYKFSLSHMKHVKFVEV